MRSAYIYHCELALAARSEGRADDATTHLKKALSTYRGCVRANHLQAQFAAAQGDFQGAVRILRQTAEQDADYLPEILPEIVSNYRHLGDLLGLRTFLRDTAARQPAAGAELAMVDLLGEQEGEREAARYLAEQLGKAPSLALLLRSVELNARMPEVGSTKFLEGLRPPFHRLLEDRPLYQCKHCGFAAKTLYWQCPSYRRWSTVKRRSAGEAKT